MSSKVLPDPLWLAMSKLRRGRLDECISICNEILASNPGDQVIYPIYYINFPKVIFDMCIYLLGCLAN